MFVSPCPVCGRSPEIREWLPLKNGVRRRIVGCPKLCSVIPDPKWELQSAYFIYSGDGDDNKIFKVWNAAVERYMANKELSWLEQDYTQWWKDKNVEVG